MMPSQIPGRQALDRSSSLAEVMKESLSRDSSFPAFSLPLRSGKGGRSGFRPALNFDLASRLSFFLWGSLPDRELLDLADSGQLVEGNSPRQVERMLKDGN